MIPALLLIIAAIAFRIATGFFGHADSIGWMNFAPMGIDSFSAVINPPQGFILAVGRITNVPVLDDCDQIIAGHRMSLTMSCDHRVIDGALGAEYLKELRHLLENPALLLV